MKQKTKWLATQGGGAPLLTMPNIPLPLHGLAPRVIMGATEWGKIRRQCYINAEDKCEICGQQLCGKRGGDYPMHQAHEVYDYDFEKLEARFVRPVCLCPTCHTGFIHSGRALTCYTKHEPLWSKDVMLRAAEHGFKLIADWNIKYPDEKPLRPYFALADWLTEPSLETDLQSLIDKYGIEFWEAPHRSEWENAWGKWKLTYKGVDYYSPYQSREEWEEALNPKRKEETKELFEGDVFEELRKLIKEKEDEINQ